MLITIKPKLEKDGILKLIEKINNEQKQLRSDLYLLEKMLKETEFEEVGGSLDSPTED